MKKQQIKKTIAAILIGASTVMMGTGVQASAQVNKPIVQYAQTYPVRTLARWYGCLNSLYWDNTAKTIEINGCWWPVYDLQYFYPDTEYYGGTIYMTEEDFVDAFGL